MASCGPLLEAEGAFVCICCNNAGWLTGDSICPLCDGAVSLGAASDATAAPTGGEPLLPEIGRRNVLVTAALPYVNNVPHLGNIIGCVLSADVYARYCRSRGYQTLFIGGTDEYGTATEIKALEEGVTPREICDKYHAIHAEIYKWFGISFDKFGRTSDPLHSNIVQSLFRKVASGGGLREDVIEQLKSEGLQRFLADRFVEGTCPKCGFLRARGDQCDHCRSLLNPAELKDPRCKFTGTTPVVRTSNHLYLDLPSLEERLREFVQRSSGLGGWSSNARSVTKDWLDTVGLQPRCITRDLKWGVPVPQDAIQGFEDKVFYVWFDAPIGYISITAEYTSEWEQWWRAPENVELTQFLGKDNILFHTLILPASLLASGERWTLLSRISATEYLNYEDSKFSKSEGVGVFGDNARDADIEPDVWRFYLLAIRPEQGDSEFRWSDLAAKTNGELVNNLGNFCHRVLDFVSNTCGGVVPKVCVSGIRECADLGKDLRKAVDSYIENLEACRLREGLKAALEVSSIGNKFLAQHRPWALIKDDPDRAGTHLAAAVGVVRLLAALLSPFTPCAATRYLHYLGLDSQFGLLSNELLAAVEAPYTLVPPQHVLRPKPAVVFSRISAERVEALKQRFAGNADSVKEKIAAKKEQQRLQKERRRTAKSALGSA
eukprot:TRINITY_DN29678_c0_g1_i2.p1 TRINITY_DN29678_c0_g1~~TRINITY_DN29678_c0_g1_i2.p1  ORF type:complete len:684 (-),score=101.79 TRINITY_DN29678_c0_g1_i2:74-2059(-)